MADMNNAKVIVNYEDMTAIANAIRTRTSSTKGITIADMPMQIDGISGGDIIAHADIPDYVKSEALRVAGLVDSVRKDDSIVFLAMSDSHHCGEQSNTGWQTNQNAGNWHATQAAKVLSYALDMDFVCHLGDLTFGHGTTTSALLHQQLEEMTSWLNESQTGIPTFMTVGNHDTGMYAVNEGTETSLESASYLFSIFGARCEGSIYGSTEYGYCYRDFEDKKLRVICLNSSERDTTVGYGANPAMSDAQLLWFAQTLKSIGTKTGWNIITLSHYPLDFATCVKASDVVKAYVTGSSITLNGTAVNFSGSNSAKFVAAFHGHTHCFKYAKLNTVSNKVATEFDAMRIAIPGSGFYRNNHQPESDGNGISFKDDITYDKTIGGAKDTAFVVNVINPTEKVVHSFCYGAGVDRVISYGDIVYHKVTKTLANCTLSNNASSIENGKPYVAEITPNEHCAVTSITITMGGVDITNTAYSDNSINIAQVTGDVVITVKAEIALACTNQIPISTNASGNIYNGKGYKEKMYMSTGTERSNSATDLTGFIPCKIGDILRLQDMPFSTAVTSCRLTFFDADKKFLAQCNVDSTWWMDTRFAGVKDANGNYIKFTINNDATLTGCAYVRISAADITESSIVTINEEIKYADEVGKTYSVTYNLTNVNSSNTATVVAGENYGYATTLTAKPGYALDTVVVIMDGTDITFSVCDAYGLINIPQVTGNIIITASAIQTAAPTYTNQLPISIDTSGNIYNGKGFKENTYLSSGNEATKSGYKTTGFMKVPTDNAKMYLKNAGWDTTDDYCRICYYGTDMANKGLAKAILFADGATNSNLCTRDANGNVVSMTISKNWTPAGGYVRLCGDGINENTIITFNEEID